MPAWPGLAAGGGDAVADDAGICESAPEGTGSGSAGTHHRIIADKGHDSDLLTARMARRGVDLISPDRKNTDRWPCQTTGGRYSGTSGTGD